MSTGTAVPAGLSPVIVQAEAIFDVAGHITEFLTVIVRVCTVAFVNMKLIVGEGPSRGFAQAHHTFDAAAVNASSCISSKVQLVSAM